MPTTKVGDISIYYEIHGKGEPLLLIMGYGGNSARWFSVLDDFSKEYRVVVFDNRGTGRSDKPNVPYTIKMMAGDAVGLLDAIGIDAAHVFGVSMGGMIAQEYALSYPDRLMSLILGCTSCGGAGAIPPTPDAAKALFDPARGQLSDEERIRGTAPWLWSQEFIDSHPDIVNRFVTDSLKHPTPPHGYACQGRAIIGQDNYDRATPD
jgi:pimeloyl-ACP methyl ester carboxylesterase